MTIKHLHLFNKKISLDITTSSTCFVGRTTKILNVPFGLSTRQIAFLNIGTIKEYAGVQFIIDVNSLQIYYRHMYAGAFTNWLLFPTELIDLCFINSIKNIGNLLEQSKKHQEIEKEIQSAHKYLLTSEQNIISDVISSDLLLFLKNEKKSIVSFVDDDSSVFIDDIWGVICKKKNIKIGFACITGMISKEKETIRNEDKQTSLKNIVNYYNDGFDVYSHSFSHDYFYKPSNSNRKIEYECKKSKAFLVKNSLYRSSNIIVYPGGLGIQRTNKKKTIKKYYRYGVDTTGNGINDQIDNYNIHRYNIDISNYNEIVEVINDAIKRNALLVFMSHSYELNKNKDSQIKKIERIIDYIHMKQMDILPLSEAIKIKDYKYKIKTKKRFSLFVFAKEIYSDFKNLKNK